MYIIYGIKNCNTMKKAMTWLDEHNVAYTFHDYKKEGISEEKITDWVAQKGWEALVNRKGTTWRMLSEAEKAMINHSESAIHLMHEKTSIIKRPLIESDGKIVMLGFDEDAYSHLWLKE